MAMRLGVLADLGGGRDSDRRARVEAAARAIQAWLQERGALARPEQADALVVLGGDGFLMRCARAHPEKPLVGVNFGRVGFLTTVEQADWPEALAEILDGRARVREEPTLGAAIEREGRVRWRGWAINEVAVVHHSSAETGPEEIEVELYVDGRFVNLYPGDGLLVSTPQGSTGYGMAAGGPVIAAGVRGFGVVPINCHSPIRTALVVPEEAVLELVLTGRHQAVLSLDNQETCALTLGESVVVRRGPHPFRLLTLSRTNFYDAFRSKFNYVIRRDARPSRAPAE